MSSNDPAGQEAAGPGAIEALLEAEGLPPSYGATIVAFWRPLAAHIAARAAAQGGPLVVGVSGSQGSGKTTLCRMLEVLLREEHGLHAATLSLDDLYLTRAERADLAATVHPLFATRGVPGTHDVAFGTALLAAVRAGQGAIRFPRFDKAQDDRAPEADWQTFAAPVDVLLFEGWCMGAHPQAEAGLVQPINRLEAEEDADGLWRRHVNAQLAGPYRALFDAPDVTIMLAAPSFAAVLGWRQLQEAKLRARTGAGMSDGEVDRFVMHYERITRNLLADLPDRADGVITLSADHAVTGLAFAGSVSAAEPESPARLRP